MREDIVKDLREVAFAIDSEGFNFSDMIAAADLLMEAAREIDYLRSRIARLEGLA